MWRRRKHGSAGNSRDGAYQTTRIPPARAVLPADRCASVSTTLDVAGGYDEGAASKAEFSPA